MIRASKGAILFLAQALFLWTYFSSQGLELLADAGARGDGARTTAYRFAAEWRHGLEGDWPIYVPGFFLVALATWFWSFRRPLRNLVWELLPATLAAGVVAFVAAPVGARAVLQGFESSAGVLCSGSPPRPGLEQVLTGGYTLVAWTVVVLSCHRALWWRKYWPLLVPVAVDAVLIAIRPFTFDDLVSTWAERVGRGEPLALVSLLLVPISAAGMVCGHLAWGESPKPRLREPVRFR